MSRSRRRLLITLAAPILILLLPELLLALSGLKAPRYAGFLDDGVYWVPFEAEGRPPGFDRAFPRNAKYVPEQPPLFLRDKPADGWRVFVLGESSVAGLPYDVGCFTDWLRLRATAMLPERAVEVVNAGNVGWHATDERTLLQECLEHQPDLLIWMVGHNEFVPHNVLALRLEVERPLVHTLAAGASRLRTVRWLGQWLPALRARRISVFDDRQSAELPIFGPERALLEQRFREVTAGAVADAQAAGVPIVLCTLARNLSASPPSGSTFSDTTRRDPELRARWDAAYAEGLAALDRGDADGALAAFGTALALDGLPAKLIFAIGRAQVLAGRPELAAAAFEQALEQDVAPMRAQAWAEGAIRDVARQSGSPLADVQARFDAAGKVGVAGDELILDNCHPNLAGHELIASLLLTVLEQQLHVPLDRSRDVSREDGRRLLGLDEYEAKLAKRVESLCLVKLVLQGGAVDDLWHKARQSCDDALALDPTDWEVSGSLGLLEAVAGHADDARVLIEQAMANNDYVRTSYVFFWRTEPPYQRALDAAGVDMSAVEAALTPEARRQIDNRLWQAQSP